MSLESQKPGSNSSSGTSQLHGLGQFFFLFSQSKTKFPYLPTGDTSTCFSGRYEEDVKYEI